MVPKLLLLVLSILCIVLMLQHMLEHVRAGGHTIMGDSQSDPIMGLDVSLTRFKSINGFCVDPRNGDVYISSTFFHRIFKMDNHTKTVSWYAGNGFQTSCSRTGSTINDCNDGEDKLYAGLEPTNCAVDPINGDLYVLYPASMHMIRKIDAKTNISTIFVGTGYSTSSGYDFNGIDAHQISVTLNQPISLVVDADFVYIVDSQNHCIRKVNKTSNLIYTHAGSCGAAGTQDGLTPTGVRFSNPYGMAFSNDGSLFIAEKSNHIIRRINPDGRSEIYAGKLGIECSTPNASPACGDGTNRLGATFSNPNSIAIDANNNVYVFDWGTNRIRKIENSTGLVTTIVGTGVNSARGDTGGPKGHGQIGTSVIISSASGSQPISIVDNRLLFHDQGLGRIRQVDLSTGIVTSFAGACLATTIGVGLPVQQSKLGSSVYHAAISFDSVGTPYILTGSNPMLLMTVTPNGILKRIAGGQGTATTYFSGVPADEILFASTGAYRLAIDKNNQDIYIADGSKLRYYNATSGYMYLFAQSVGFSTITSVGILSTGDIIVAEQRRVRRISKSTELSTYIAGTGSSCTTSPCGDGAAATSATFTTISSIAVDNSDNIYIMDSGAYCLRKIDAITGNIEKVAGTYNNLCGDGVCGDEGLATNAGLGLGKSIDIHPITGDIYLTDSTNGKIRKISGGVISTVVGSGSIYDSLDSGAWASPLEMGITPSRVSFDPSGNMYFNDGGGVWTIRVLKNGVVVPYTGFLTSADKFSYNGENLSPSKVTLPLPSALYLDSNGNTFVGCIGASVNSNENDARIVKLDSSSNTVSTFIGSLVELSGGLPPENVNGTKTSLKSTYTSIITGVYTPIGLHVTSNGDVYFTDSMRYAIRMYNATLGTVSTVAGVLGTACTISPSCGDGQSALTAQFKQPTTIFVTDDGTIYVSDTGNNQIRKVQNGIVSAIAGTGRACSSAGSAACDSSTSPLGVDLLKPMGIYVTKSGEVYFADTGNHKIRKISSDGLTITTVAGSTSNCASGSTSASPCSSFSASATDSTAKLYYPTGVVVNETTNTIYIADQGTHTIRVVKPSGSMSIYGGSFIGQQFFVSGATYTTFYSPEGSSKYLNFPASIFLKDNKIHVVEPLLGRVRSLTQNCLTGYSGENCEITTCNGVLSNNSTTCSSHGVCVEYNICNCSAGYSGNDCSQVFTPSNPISCFGLSSLDVNVCSGQGSCIAADSCSCNSGFFGSMCEIVKCFGKLSNDSSVCGGRGSCNTTNNCLCSSNYFGDECQFSTCFNTQSNDSSVCSAHGQCISYNQCNCSFGFYGINCNVATCNSILSNDSSVCSSNGVCVGSDNCQCDTNYYGPSCNVTTCGGLLSNDSSVCSGNGKCVDFNQCVCSQNSGSNCEIQTPSNTNTTHCFGILSNDSSVCSSHGVCNSTDVCSCSGSYHGIQCELTGSSDNTTNSTTNTNNSTNNGNNGNSTSNNSTNTNTNNTTDPNNGNSTNQNSTNPQNSWTCSGIEKDNVSVCSTHGVCSSLNVCNCQTGFSGSNCELHTCNGIAHNVATVCSGHGDCNNVNNCTCNSGYLGTNCEILTCSSTRPCLHNGACTSVGICSCISYFEGNLCEIPKCSAVSPNSKTVCDANGNCICQCPAGYSGEWCDKSFTISGSSTLEMAIYTFFTLTFLVLLL